VHELDCITKTHVPVYFNTPFYPSQPPLRKKISCIHSRGTCISPRATMKLFFLWRCCPTRVMASSFLRILDHTQRRMTVGRTPLDERSARRRDLYLTTHNTRNRQTPIPPGGIRTHDLSRPQTYALDRAATGTGTVKAIEKYKNSKIPLLSQASCYVTSESLVGQGVRDSWCAESRWAGFCANYSAIHSHFHPWSIFFRLSSR